METPPRFQILSSWFSSPQIPWKGWKNHSHVWCFEHRQWEDVKKKKVLEALLIETSWRKTSSAPNQTLPWAGRSAQLGLHRLCRELAVRAMCKIPTKRRVGNSPYFRGRHARVAQILVESQLQSWECLVEKMLAGKSVKLLVEAAWMSKIWSLRLRQGKGQSWAPQGSHRPLISFFCSITAKHYFSSEQLFHEFPRGLAPLSLSTNASLKTK